MNHIPVFGEKNEGKDYQARYGVYSIVARENKEICLVQAPTELTFFPEVKLKLEKIKKKRFTVNLWKNWELLLKSENS